MKLFCTLVSVLFLIPHVGHGATNTAAATLSCYSLQVLRGSDTAGNYLLDFSSVSGGINGELALDFFNSGYTHSAYLTLQDELFGDTLAGQIGLDVPLDRDGNRDGFPDFFQVSQGITNLTSSGAYNLQVYGSGTASAVWNRPAGASYGTCTLAMMLMPMNKVVFTMPFQVLNYLGTLAYVPGTNTVTGTVALSQTNNPNAVFNGTVAFTKSSTDRFNELTLQAGSWTNELSQAVFYTHDSYSRDPRWPTNYFGSLDMIDPSNPTGFYPYGTWLVSIDDSNDSNRNGIPDFSDDPSTNSVPHAARLELATSSTNVLLTLHADVGSTADLQRTTNLSDLNWQTALSVTVTNNPQTLPLPIGSSGVVFYRVRSR